MSTNKITFQRDIQNKRINNIEDHNHRLFANNINVQPRPSVSICSSRSRSNEQLDTHQQLNLPIPYPRPIISTCDVPKMTFRNSQTKHDLSYCQVFTEPLRDNKDISRPYADMIWNQVTNRSMTEPDCHRNR